MRRFRAGSASCDPRYGASAGRGLASVRRRADHGAGSDGRAARGRRAVSVAALIGAAAGLVQAASYLIYVAQTLRRDCRPNGMSWVMWSYGGLVVVAMQVHLGAPWTVVAVPAVGLACSVAIAVVAFSRCDRLRPDRQDWTALGIDAMLTAGYVAAVAAGALSRAFGAVVALVGLCALTSAWPALRSQSTK